MTISMPPPGVSLQTPEVDPSWMRAALVQAGVATADAQLDEVRFEEFIGTGQLGRSARFTLDWARPNGEPTSVVAKIPGVHPELTAVLFDTGMYDAEIAFYNDVAPYVDVARPTCFHASSDRESLNFVILMEDLAAYRAGDQLKGIAMDDIHRAIEQAAAFHGPRWGDPELAKIPFYAGRNPDGADFTAKSYRDYLPEVFSRLGDGLSAAAIDTVERFGAVIGDWVHRTPEAPATITHGDFRPDNLLLSPETPDRPMIVVDWQTLGLGAGPNDIAYLIGGATDAEQRRRSEDELLREYLGYLRDRYAVTDYTESQLRQDYALGALSGLLVAVTATIRAIRTERGDALFTLMIERHAAHARELGSVELAGG
ncbi:MAG: phosphotransferase [Cumulibacter sp.]